MSAVPSHAPVVIVGAGQAGLAVAYYLRRFELQPGSDFVILDRGPGAGGAWQFRWDALRLGSVHHVNDLPGMGELGLSFATADRHLPAKDIVSGYYHRYEEGFGLNVFRPLTVRTVENRGADLVVRYGAARAKGGTTDRAGSGAAAGTTDRAPGSAGGSASGVDDEPLEERPSKHRSTWRSSARRRGETADAAPSAARPAADPGGEIRTGILVNATGTWGSPFVPYYPGVNVFRGRHVHTNGYVAAEEFRGQNVVVVGGGTSAIGFLLELEGVAESVAWAARRPIDYRDEPELSIEGGVAAVSAADVAARAGVPLPSIVSTTGVPRSRRIAAGIERGVLRERPMFAALEEDGVRWRDGSFSPADAIIWATGFRSELRHLAPLGLRQKEGGVIVDSGQVYTDPRIFLAGYGPYASTLGANRSGRVIARQIMAIL